MASMRLATTCTIKTAQPPKPSSLIKAPISLGSVKTISESFGIKSSSFRTTCVAVYKVKLIGPNGEENEFEVPDDAYILDSAENAGMELRYSCTAGAPAYSTCAAEGHRTHGVCTRRW